MPQDKEFEIRLQFLEEAQDYLNIIESVLIGLATAHVDNQQIDAVLRAAHSLKGGAAMMRFQTLSDLSHRMEDFLKVLKTQNFSTDAALESLLLAGVDCLRQVIAQNRQGLEDFRDVDEQWLETHINQVFEQLNQYLGAPQAEDTTTLLLPEDGQDDMLALIFETEVEGCLQRLESVLADSNNPCLLEEISIMTQELGGLGEMLQLNAFSSLCESITQHLEATPERVEEIARLALQEWRRSQAALLVGQVDTLPTQITLGTGTEVPTNLVTNQIEIDGRLESLLNQIPEAYFDEVNLQSTVQRRENVDILNPHAYSGELLPTTENKSEIKRQDSQIVHLSGLSELKSEFTPSTNLKEHQENTVRVPIKLLDQLNDLLGELTIARNGLNLYLERLRNLVSNLSHRVRTLQRIDLRPWNAYDKVAIQAGAVPSLAPIPERRATIDDSKFKSDPDTTQITHETSSKEFESVQTKREIEPAERSQLLPSELMENIVRIQEVTDDIDLSLEDTDQTVRELNRTAKHLQTSLTQVRMRPLSDLVGKFPRFLRELCLQYGKNVELKIHGGSTLIDRTILEALSDPLMHLLRNAFDHGIEDPATRQACGKPEQGVIEIRALTRGNQTLIAVSDDGGGIDLDTIRQRANHLSLDAAAIAQATDEKLLTLIFEPGFSTAGQVTALSGRGVGLDVVRTNLRQIRGDIKVDTQIGVGTTFTLSVPLTLSVARVLIVESNGMLLAFPSDAIEQMLLFNPEQILTAAGLEVLDWEGYITPLVRLGHWLEFQCPHKTVETDAMPTTSVPTVLMISQGNERVAIQVDRCWGEQEVAVRQVEGTIAMPPGFTGCTILGDGRVVPLVNAPELLHWIASCKQLSNSKQEDKPPEIIRTNRQKDTILVVDDSINVRRFLSLTLEKAGYRVELAQDGQDALEKLLSGLQIKAVICDIDMPRLNGYGLLARVKSNPAFKDLPIVMLTSRAGNKERQLAMNLGATAYFSKPYNEQELLQTLKQLIQN